MNHYAVPVDALKEYTKNLFLSTGLKENDAAEVADLLVAADVRGVRSHGVMRAPAYIEKLLHGGASKTSEYPVIRQTATTAVIDAQGGLGALAGVKAVNLAREMAKKDHVGIVSVGNSNHFGMAAHWALKLAGDDMIGFACSNNDLSMGPPGCRVPFMGNNPFAFAFYAGPKYPEFCSDMAVSAAALGKAKDLAMRGKPIPHGWLLDKDGNDTTDVNECFMQVPMAQHKGFGIACIVELFATLLSGGVLSNHVHDQDDPYAPEMSSQCFAAFDISAFRDLGAFRADASQWIDELHELPMKEGKAKYPGEIEFGNKQVNLREGVVLPEKLVTSLAQIGASFKLDGSFLTQTPTDRA